MTTYPTDDDFDYPHLDDSRINDLDDPIEELFDMVYDWGRHGVAASHHSPAFRDKLLEIIEQYIDMEHPF